MALLDTASLIVTPNGYKASKLYSIVPMDGTGDMTFSRTGNTATRVNSSGLIETVNANIPRLDYTDSTCPKLLMEPQRTNLITYSDQFDQVTWGKVNTIVLSNQIASPDGTSNADKLTNSNINTDEYIEKFSMPTTAGTYTASIFVKNSDATTSAIRAVHLTEGTSTSQMTYTWATNTFTLTGSNAVSGKVISYGNGWVRLIFTYSIGTVTDHRFRFYGQGFDKVAKFVYIYGAQVELGAFATSYIPTTTASVTRNADFSNKTGISALLNVSQGTFVFKYQNIKPSSSGSTVPFEISNGTDTSKIGLFFNISAGRIGVRITIGAGSLTEIETASYTTTDLLTIVVRYSSTDLSMWINGTLVSTTTSPVVMSALDRITFGQFWGGTLAEGKIEKLAYWKTALTNSECLTLSQS